MLFFIEKRYLMKTCYIINKWSQYPVFSFKSTTAWVGGNNDVKKTLTKSCHKCYQCLIQKQPSQFVFDAYFDGMRCISALGKENLHLCDKSNNSHKNILKFWSNTLYAAFKTTSFTQTPYIFQQDSAKTHTLQKPGCGRVLVRLKSCLQKRMWGFRNSNSTLLLRSERGETPAFLD